MAETGSSLLRRRPLLTGLFVLVALALLLALGTWQVERLTWKENLLAELNQRLKSPPIPLAEMEALNGKGENVDYRPMQVTGRFDHARERHFLATWNGESGFYVYTPLALPDGRSLLVNRGFVPYQMKTPEKRLAGQVEGDVTITGLARARLDGKPSFLVPDNDLKKDIFYWKDLDAMATSAGLDPKRVVPFFLDANKTPNPGGLPVGGVTLVDLPNNHLQYAVTWYGLAAALAAIAVVTWRRSRAGNVDRS